MYDEIIVIGVVISLIYFELTGWSPGGIIVAGYLGAAVRLPHRQILYNRRREPTMVGGEKVDKK